MVGVEFTDGDAAKTKSIVSDYLQREGQLDGVWMDAGATAVAAMEAFEDNGQEIPPFVGEDQNDFLTKWKEDGLTADRPDVLELPVADRRHRRRRRSSRARRSRRSGSCRSRRSSHENLDEYVDPNMPPLHYALCGCEDMPGYPEDWGGK